LLDGIKRDPAASWSATIAAWRFAYLFFLRQSLGFPLVEIPHWSQGRMTYSGLEALMPGREPNLDTICSAIIEGKSLAAPPRPRDDTSPGAEQSTIADRIARFARA
jgi:hypothetical protein